MEKYMNTLRNDDVMKYLNEVMNRLAQIESENSLKDKRLYNYDLEVRRLQNENLNLHNQINYYKSIESTLNNSMAMVKHTSEQIKNNTLKEREVIINDAKGIASRILNDALMKAEKIEEESQRLRRNIVTYKRRIRNLIEEQMNIIDDLDKVDLNDTNK